MGAIWTLACVVAGIAIYRGTKRGIKRAVKPKSHAQPRTVIGVSGPEAMRRCAEMLTDPNRLAQIREAVETTTPHADDRNEES